MPIKMKVCNVADYNESLKKRGKIFHLFDEAVKVWLNTVVEKKARTKYVYSDRLMEILAVFRYLFKLPYRQLEGLLEDYLTHKNIELPIPDFTTLCRRMAKLSLSIDDHRDKNSARNGQLVDVLIDSTGINIYHTGGGHSKENSCSRKYKRYDQFRKLHVAYVPQNKKIAAIKMTCGKTTDGHTAPILLKAIPFDIGAVYADGAYDRSHVRRACLEKHAKQIIPPQRRALVHKSKWNEPEGLWDERNAAIKIFAQHTDEEEGRKKWKEDNSYGKRSLVEAFFSKFKAIFGFSFMSKKDVARESELATKIRILNSFSDLGCAIFKKAA